MKLGCTFVRKFTNQRNLKKTWDSGTRQVWIYPEKFNVDLSPKKIPDIYIYIKEVTKKYWP